MPKILHDFNGGATVNEFRKVMGQEFLDNLPKGTQIYVRKADEGCWKVATIVVEDSGVYIEAGEETNAQIFVQDVEFDG